MAQEYPQTAAVRALKAAGVAFKPHLYAYQERGGTAHSSAALGVAEHQVIKTLIMETEQRQPLVVLMHGDFEVSTRALARILGCKSVTPCRPEVATKHTGYLIGGTSPFGLRRPMPVYAERSIFDLPTVYLNGGKRGFLVSLDSSELLRLLSPLLVEVRQAVETPRT